VRNGCKRATTGSEALRLNGCPLAIPPASADPCSHCVWVVYRHIQVLRDLQVITSVFDTNIFAFSFLFLIVVLLVIIACSLAFRVLNAASPLPVSMAAETALINRHVVSNILHHLSDMKYKDRRQYGPDQPVEFLEFRPTLVPSILVNRLWADAGTSILWRRYPHLPALKEMSIERRQYYANKVQRVFALSPPPGSTDSLEYLEGLAWPSLKRLELEVDVMRHGIHFAGMVHAGLEHLEISGFQSGDSNYFSEVVLPALLVSRPFPRLIAALTGTEPLQKPQEPPYWTGHDTGRRSRTRQRIVRPFGRKA